ncbi:uncharacterized protein LOC119666050 isoform X1 [Teleopsis dalmanni]|uniref:uncharacterized protein LOC119666050 isoform X1 n=1 Tax=Teleopsis dalmanni TaxID=139649 RepID=UPI0018CE1CEB|nr:uncharacterized protein LOC119666050 isoform X1 [Teleopsis dalmanni]
MTSYAATNDTSHTTSPATANSEAVGDEHNTTTACSVEVMPTKNNSPIDHLTTKLAATPLQDLHFDNQYCFDSDSLSDGREKADTTPENIKKIDDVINEDRRQKRTAFLTQQHQYDVNGSAVAAGADISAKLKLGYGSVGLAAAVDDSNAKIRLAKTLCSTKDTLHKDRRVENTNVMASSLPLQEADDNGNEHKLDNAISKCETPEDVSSASNNSTITTTTSKQSYAFTIDNFSEKDCDPAAAAAKYKSLLERFQSRHRRGASMSKIENNTTNESPTSITASTSASPLTPRSVKNREDNENDGQVQDSIETPPKVKLRARDRSTSRVRDASKRHSWSPRSSTQEPLNSQTQSTVSTASKTATPASKKNTTNRKSTVTAAQQVPKGASNLVANRTHFTPRSTAMQMALQKVDFMCPQPPLSDYRCLDTDADADNVSETGTYTLDGDNYTEEQKEVMNIDCGGDDTNKNRPKNLNLSRHNPESTVSSTKIPVHVSTRTNNVLEVNYYHELAEQAQRSNPSATSNDLLLGSHQSAGDYLEKLKSRVLRNVGGKKDGGGDFLSSSSSCEGGISLSSSHKNKKFPVSNSQKTSTEEEDVGCFTSVTTSGVLAKQPTLEATPKTARLCLSTSQIDSSEYISNESKLKNPAASSYAKGGFTDHQKAAYRLNVFTNQKDSQKFAATRKLIESPPESPIELSDTAILKTASSKNDWIKEWARNARARSLANDTGSHSKQDTQELMTRSYTCASGSDGVNDEKLLGKHMSHTKLNKTLAERLRVATDCDYTSDPTLSTYSKINQDVNYKPPKSPTKIPSPMHTLSRARSVTRPRGSLQNIVCADDEDIYLQNTALAINTLQQSLSRKNSLKSIPQSGSPRAYSARPSSNSVYSPEAISPEHSYNSPTTGYQQRSPLHRRNNQQQINARNQLMTSSINEQQLALLTSGEYLVKQMRMRKNSFDGTIGNSPKQAQEKYIQTPNTESDQDSPLRRSSSFSTKIATQRTARPQYQNIYTPPALRNNYVPTNTNGSTNSRPTVSSSHMTKSASSNNFGRMYSDYDDNLQYYINDEDDAGDEYYRYSDGEDGQGIDDNYYEPDELVHSTADTPVDTQNVPLTNTRYNKALLMRIERSKQRVAGKPTSAPAQGRNALTGAGVAACPNTPELPRRNVKSAVTRTGAMTSRQSVPRDTSLSRLATQVPNSLASAKKQLLQTAAAVPNTAKPTTTTTRVQPKYMDISKYKPAQSNNFLRKNDTRSTLKTDAIKRSPSATGISMNRADPTRMSNRSVKSVASNMTASTNNSVSSARASSAARRDVSVTKQKEAELAMWKRRATYDPMKAAAEDRRRKEEAKKMARNSGELNYESSYFIYYFTKKLEKTFSM